MKVPKKGDFIKKNAVKKKVVSKIKPKKEHVMVVAQEIKYARLLAGNEKGTRDRVLKTLKKWLTNCLEKGYDFQEDDFLRVWKGLFYAMWMSDKPLIQEELCENIAAIFDLFPAEHLRHALLLMKAGFKTLATEWYGIDQHRMDKFLMLARRYLRGSFRCVKRCDWQLSACEQFASVLAGSDSLFALQTPLYARNALSLQLHIIDCYLEELSKVSGGDVEGASVAALLRPFVEQTALGQGALAAASRRLLVALLRQSAAGQAQLERARAYRQMGCPPGGPDALELVTDDEDSEDEQRDDGSEQPLDPRAGRVDVTLAPLEVPSALLARALAGRLPRAAPRARRRAAACLQRFESLAAGQYPLPEEAAPPPPPRRRRAAPAARALAALEASLKDDKDELKLRGLSRKHRKRLLRKARAGRSIVEDLPTDKYTNKHKIGEWLVESMATDAEDKENKNKRETRDKSKKRKLDCVQNGDDANKKVKTDFVTAKKDVNKDNSSGNNNIMQKMKVIQNKKHKVTLDGNKNEKIAVSDKQTKLENINDMKQNIKQNGKIKAAPKLKLDKKEDFTTELIPKKVQIPKAETPKVLINKLKNYQKQIKNDRIEKAENKFQKDMKKSTFETPKKVKFVLKNNSMQKAVDYYKSVRQSPSIPFDGTKKPVKTNLKPSSPSPINPFFKKKLKLKN